MSLATKMSDSSPPNGSPQMELPLMSSAVASPARTSALQALGLGLTERAAAYGLKFKDLLANYDHASSTWKTSQRCLVGGWTAFSETFPSSGLMLSGTLFRLPPLERAIDVDESGLWPTPTTDSASDRSTPYAQGGMPLALSVKLWPTPTVCGNHNRKGLSKTSGDGLATAVKMWPTLSASDNRDRGNLGMPAIQRRAEKGKQLMPSMVVSETSGALNPTWVEWLMGFPIGWTDLEPSETPSSPKYPS